MSMNTSGSVVLKALTSRERPYIVYDFGGVLGRPLDPFVLGSHNFHGHSSWLVCFFKVALTTKSLNPNPKFLCKAWEIVILANLTFKLEPSTTCYI